MNPSKVVRSKTRALTDLPNVGPATAEDLRMLGIIVPQDLVGKKPLELFNRLQELTGRQQDPCVLDVLMSVTDFMSGAAAKPWWSFTKKRKKLMEEMKSTE
ncbi:MAG: helix-hairpin-helix domain-containing protein [Pirellulales bacterium]